MTLKVFIGVDDREEIAFRVCKFSIERRASEPVDVIPLRLQNLRHQGYYWRTWHVDGDSGVRVDDIDNRPFSTDFTYSRFLVPALAGYQGTALFCDCDFLFLDDVAKLFNDYPMGADTALACVKHNYEAVDNVKMDGQIQQNYPRKNWSSFILWNAGHPKNKVITPAVVNTSPGSFLHQFQWLEDEEIGEIEKSWNYLINVYTDHTARAAHFTSGGPWLPQYTPDNTEYAKEWMNEYCLYLHSIETRPTLWPSVNKEVKKIDTRNI